jgi:hypothetical protein
MGTFTEESQALFVASHDTTPNLIYARAVTATLNLDQTINKKLGTLILLEIRFSKDLVCDN